MLEERILYIFVIFKFLYIFQCINRLTFGVVLHAATAAISAAKAASLGGGEAFLANCEVLADCEATSDNNLDPRMRASARDQSRFVSPLTVANMTHPLSSNLPSSPLRPAQYYLENDILVMSRRAVSIITSQSSISWMQTSSKQNIIEWTNFTDNFEIYVTIIIDSNCF